MGLASGGSGGLGRARTSACRHFLIDRHGCDPDPIPAMPTTKKWAAFGVRRARGACVDAVCRHPPRFRSASARDGCRALSGDVTCERSAVSSPAGDELHEVGFALLEERREGFAGLVRAEVANELGYFLGGALVGDLELAGGVGGVFAGVGSPQALDS